MATTITGSSIIPWDNTIPQNTEGDQVLSVTFNCVSGTQWYGGVMGSRSTIKEYLP
jgi:hypothetical protein